MLTLHRVILYLTGCISNVCCPNLCFDILVIIAVLAGYHLQGW